MAVQDTDALWMVLNVTQKHPSLYKAVNDTITWRRTCDCAYVFQDVQPVLRDVLSVLRIVIKLEGRTTP
jgi:hypothetical protein